MSRFSNLKSFIYAEEQEPSAFVDSEGIKETENDEVVSATSAVSAAQLCRLRNHR